jgi:hypothetical protein
MSVSAYVGGVGLYADWLGILLGALGLLLAWVIAVALYRRQWLRAACLVFVFGAVCVATASQVWLARPEVWVDVSAYYSSADPDLRRKIAADLRRDWIWSDEIRVSSWIVLAEQWGICHGYWPQSHCVRPSGERLPMGIAREHLASITRGSRFSWQ